MKMLKNLAAAAAMLVLTVTAQASLISLGDGTVKDTTTNLIWLEDWNVNGFQSQATQIAWANNLTFAGSSDWRLPTIGDYYSLAADIGNLTEVNSLLNVQAADSYWTRTPRVGSGSIDCDIDLSGNCVSVIYYPRVNQDDQNYLPSRAYAVAVRSGAVSATVPEPQSLALVMLAVGAGLLATKRRPA